VHLDTIKVYFSPTNAQVIVLKAILKFTLKIAPTCFGAVNLLLEKITTKICS
jgi:hypothetical protein